MAVKQKQFIPKHEKEAAAARRRVSRQAIYEENQLLKERLAALERSHADLLEHKNEVVQSWLKLLEETGRLG